MSEHKQIKLSSLEDLKRAYSYAKHREDFLSDYLSGYYTGTGRKPESNPLYVELQLAKADAAFYKREIKERLSREE